MFKYNESELEVATLEWLEELGYDILIWNKPKQKWEKHN